MDLWIDVVAGTVESDNGSWPLTLDGRTGGAGLHVGGTSYVVRPLRWGEKQRLARFATHGQRVLSREVVSVALAGGPEPDQACCELLAGVVAWLDDPRGSRPSALPIEADVLAAAALELLRATGLRPDDLDDRDAAEVEALWRAARAELAATDVAPARMADVATPADEWANATMIRIQSDSDGADEGVGEPEGNMRSDFVRQVPTAAEATDPSAVASPAPNPSVLRNEAREAQPPADGDTRVTLEPGAGSERRPRILPAGNSATEARVAGRAGRDGVRPRRTGRIVGPVPAGRYPGAGSDSAPLVRTHAPRRAGTEAPSNAAPALARARESEQRSPGPAYQLLEHAWPSIDAPLSAFPGSGLPLASSSVPASTVADAALVEAILDVLTDGLEEAAIDAGIEV